MGSTDTAAAEVEFTTVELSAETCARLRALGGSTPEDTIVEALDALEERRSEERETKEFWAQADTWKAWYDSLAPERRARIDARDAQLDASDGIE